MKKNGKCITILLLSICCTQCLLPGQNESLLLRDIQYIEVETGATRTGSILIADGKIRTIADTIIRDTPEQLVQQQLNAYNARDIDAFMAPYSEDVELYNFPDQLRTKGKANMRASYAQMFAQVPELHCELVNRTVLGNTVIDHERVTGLPGGRMLEAIAIYKIRDGKIAQVYFISN